MTTITNVPLYVAIAVKHGLKLYMATGMKPNRAWTPTAMLRKASEITGQEFKRGQYAQAVAALDAYLDAAEARGETLTSKESGDASQ